MSPSGYPDYPTSLRRSITIVYRVTYSLLSLVTFRDRLLREYPSSPDPGYERPPLRCSSTQMVPAIWMRVQMKKGGVWGAHAVFFKIRKNGKQREAQGMMSRWGKIALMITRTARACVWERRMSGSGNPRRGEDAVSGTIPGHTALSPYPGGTGGFWIAPPVHSLSWVRAVRTREP